MPKADKVAVKRGPGRPATGRDPTIGGRVPQKTIDGVDAYAEANGITRSAALALLLDAGLKRPPRIKAKASQQ